MPSLYLLYHLDGRTVISDALELKIKVIQPCDELHFRGVAFDDDELLLEDTFDDKPAAVIFQSSFAKQFVEANVLLFIKPERVLMTRRWGLLSGLVGQFSVCIHNIGKKRVATRENARPRRASVFVGQTEGCRTKTQLAVSLQKQKSAAEKFSKKLCKTSVTASEGGFFPCAILQPCGRQNKPSVRTGAVVSGHRNRGISVGCILQHERSVFLFRSLSRYKSHEMENGILNGLKHKTEHTCFTTTNRTFNLKNVTPWLH